LLLHLAFERQPVLEGNLRARLNAALDAPDGVRGLVGRRKLSGVFQDLLHKLLAGFRFVNVID
jgi:hypothetical protein